MTGPNLSTLRQRIAEASPACGPGRIVKLERAYAKQILEALEVAKGGDGELVRWRGLRDAIAELEGYGPDWPEHGNAPLAIAAAWALRRKRIGNLERSAAEAETARDRLLAVAKAYEAWEGDVILNADWGGPVGEYDTPILTQAQWDRLVEIQTMRNAALAHAASAACAASRADGAKPEPAATSVAAAQNQGPEG